MSDFRLEVVCIPVSDVDRAKRFYTGLGWRLDADLTTAGRRVVQVTPPGSECSVQFGEGLTTAHPGSIQGLILAVYDMESARAELGRCGVEVSEVFHYDEARGRMPGPDAEGRSYATHAAFDDPDGNGWLLQEVKARLPGRVGQGPTLLIDVATLTELLRETETHHALYEPDAPKHPWSEWYAAYSVARERGQAPDEAARDAARLVERNPRP